MKTLPTVLVTFLQHRASRRNLILLGKFILVLVAMITFYSILFHYLMAMEGRQYSWITGFYWTLTVMSTLGFGDITFTSDTGRIFSVIVLLSGTLFLLVLLPFTFIQFFYAPWMEAQTAARAPDRLPAGVSGHVVLTNVGPVDTALIRRLGQHHVPYVVVANDLPEALRLHDQGFDVVRGALDDPETYRNVRVESASLVATTRSDVVNTNVAFTVREISSRVPIVATAATKSSVDILELAGCNRVLQLGEMMGQSLARRIIGSDAKTHVIGEFGELLIAEATAANTPLVGKTLRDTKLRENLNVSVVGIWERGVFYTAQPETRITPHTVLVLAGSRAQLDNYDEVFCIYNATLGRVVIIGGGRVGRAIGRALSARDIGYRIIEKLPERIRDPEKYVLGDAADLEVLERAGMMDSPAVVVTTHDDDINVYLTIYCRRLRPDIQIISRATRERNVSTLHRAGADFTMSYASMGAHAIFNLLQRSDILMMAEGLDVFKVHLPESLAGKTIAETGIRARTGCTIIAVDSGGALNVNPDPNMVLPDGADIILIGSAESEDRFLHLFG